MTPGDARSRTGRRARQELFGLGFGGVGCVRVCGPQPIVDQGLGSKLAVGFRLAEQLMEIM